MKKILGILIEIALNIWIALGSMHILAMLILSIQEHSIFLFLCIISDLLFLDYRSFTSLIKFIPMYSILFDVILNRIFFLLSLSDH